MNDRFKRLTEEIASTEYKLSLLKADLAQAKRNCDHNWVEQYPMVNDGWYSEKCTKCEATRGI